MSDAEMRDLAGKIEWVRHEVIHNRDEFLSFVVDPQSGLMARVYRIEQALAALCQPGAPFTVVSTHDPRGVCVTEPKCAMCIAREVGTTRGTQGGT